MVYNKFAELKGQSHFLNKWKVNKKENMICEEIKLTYIRIYHDNLYKKIWNQKEKKNLKNGSILYFTLV